MICIHCGQMITDGVERCPLCREVTAAAARSFYQPDPAPIPREGESLTEEPLTEEPTVSEEETGGDLEELLSAKIRQLREYVTNLWKRGTEDDGR